MKRVSCKTVDFEIVIVDRLLSRQIKYIYFCFGQKIKLNVTKYSHRGNGKHKWKIYKQI